MPLFKPNFKEQFLPEITTRFQSYVKALEEIKRSEYLGEFPTENRKCYFPEAWYVMDEYSS